MPSAQSQNLKQKPNHKKHYLHYTIRPGKHHPKTPKAKNQKALNASEGLENLGNYCDSSKKQDHESVTHAALISNSWYQLQESDQDVDMISAEAC